MIVKVTQNGKSVDLSLVKLSDDLIKIISEIISN
nr:MAG TPA: hypothetical protein [Bacteriophage sp.]